MPRSALAAYLKQEKDRSKEAQRRRAQAEVQSDRERIQELKGAHRSCSESVDWPSLASRLSPAPPFVGTSLETIAENRRRILSALGFPERELPNLGIAVIDEANRLEALKLAHEQEVIDQQYATKLATRVLENDLEAFREVLRDHPFHEIAIGAGLVVEFIVNSPMVVESRIAVEGSSVLPREAAALSASGKLTRKAMPRQEFVELYQDYVCSLALRVAREVLALLPVDAVVVTALSDDGFDTFEPVLSSILYRHDIQRLDFQSIDPSDALDALQTRTNFRASRRSGAFQPILPFTHSDAVVRSSRGSLSELIRAGRDLLESLE